MMHEPIRLLDVLRSIEGGQRLVGSLIGESAARIDAADGAIGAFVARAPARSMAAAEIASGPLAGIALGVKDIFDTADMPTEYGSSIYRGHQPAADAAVVAMARARGAAIMGKTATTEFAFFQPAATRNPHQLGHTPGGSSSGSAAAVASGMIAGAFGSQTAGSVIRPASFCGVTGYKPSFRLLPTVGMKSFAWSLDTVGLFAAGARDAAALAALLTGRDLMVREPQAASALRVGLYRSRVDPLLDPAMKAAVDRTAALLERAGARLVEVEECDGLAAGREAQGLIQAFEGALSLGHERRVHADLLSARLTDALAIGADITPELYDDNRRTARNARRLTRLLFDDVDVILAPSALGPAPESLEATGDPAMNKLWTLAGTPCINVPGWKHDNGLPLGVSVVAQFGKDRFALEVAALVEELIAKC